MVSSNIISEHYHKPSLVLVGSGIKFMSHLTVEAKAYILHSSKVLYLVNEPVMQEWIQKNNKNSESLTPLYAQSSLRLYCYKVITDYILETLRKTKHLCVVMYGHPTVFAQPGLMAIRQARKEGFYTRVLPGISAEDCLFADLLIDPGFTGCQSYEATDFLLCTRSFEPTSHLILWQVGIIGCLENIDTHDNKLGATCLKERLLKHYSEKHVLILYEAAQYPHQEPIIQEFFLKDLASLTFSKLSTLYIPPLGQKDLDQQIIKKLNISIKNLYKTM